MTTDGRNLALLLTAWTALVNAGSGSELAAILDEGVVWQGLLPDLVCSNRDQVLRLLVRNRPLRITPIEAEEFGDRVAISVQGPDFGEGPGAPEAAGVPLLPAGAPRSLVFTFRDGRVVRMESLPNRDAAFALAEAREASPRSHVRSAPGS